MLFLVALAGCSVKQSTVSSESAQPIQVETLAKSTSSWDGRPLPSYPQGQAEITVLKITIQPGVTLNWHKHPVMNAGVLLSGQLRVESISGEVLQLRKGDTIIELVDKWHHGINDGLEPAEVIVFYAGQEGTPLSVERP
ncbi:MAG: cupin domain-containing protein [Pseudomonadota bacterium]